MTRDVLFHVCEADVSLLGQSGTRGRGGGEEEKKEGKLSGGEDDSSEINFEADILQKDKFFSTFLRFLFV